jgi:hypothetical protein
MTGKLCAQCGKPIPDGEGLLIERLGAKPKLSAWVHEDCGKEWTLAQMRRGSGGEVRMYSDDDPGPLSP